MNPARTVSFATLVRAEPARCYDAVAMASGLDGWFTRGAEVEARAGGTIIFRWKEWGPHRVSGQSRGTIMFADRPGRFAFQWQASFAQPRLVTTVELSFESDAGGTVVSVREGEFPDTPAGLMAMLENASSWGEALTLMKFFVEHGLRY